MANTSYQLSKLPYDFKALEPVISAEILELHYSKHHKGYVDNLNKALDQYHEAERKNDINTMVSLESAISFNGGGHINHSLFWETLTSPSKARKVKGDLLKAIEKDFGSFESFQEKFNAKAVPVQGSGWAWLGYDKLQKQLRIATTQNHGTITNMGLIPLIIVDVWEHAYYLQYQNKRADFVSAIWKLLNWDTVESRFSKALG